MASSTKPLQTVFLNARLIGYPADQTFTVLVDDGVICSFTSLPMAHIPSPSIEFVDLGPGELWVGPSLVDNHVHWKWWTLTQHRLDLSSAKSARQVLSMVADAITQPKYDENEEINFVAEKMFATWDDLPNLTREALDNISDTRPIYLIFAGGHSVQMNTAALKAAGIDPKDHSGCLVEAEAFPVIGKLSTVSEDVLDDWQYEMAKEASAKGITQIVELEITHNIPAWTRRIQKGHKNLRVHAGMYDEHIDYAIGKGYKSGDVVPETDGLLTVGPYKIITDGSLGSRTAYCHDPYPDTTDYGLWTYETKTLKEMVKKGVENGLTLAVHAIGDKAIHLSLESMAEMGQLPLAGSTIEHAQLMGWDDLPLFKQLGLTASIQPCHLIDDRELCSKFWPKREERAYAFGSIVKAGIPIKLGSDCPVSALDPFEQMAVAISRTEKGHENEGAWFEEEVITMDEAWCGTTWSGRKGIKMGDKADMVVLSGDVLACDAKGLRAMEVKGTMLAGNWTYRNM